MSDSNTPAEHAAPPRVRKRFSRFTVAILVTLTLGVVMLAPNIRVLVEQRQQIADLEQSVADSEALVEDLEQENARWDDPAYIRAQTRQRLFFVMPGEQTYIVLNDVEQTVEPTFSRVNYPAETIQRTKFVWTERLLESVVEAGITTEQASE